MSGVSDSDPGLCESVNSEFRAPGTPDESRRGQPVTLNLDAISMPQRMHARFTRDIDRHIPPGSGDGCEGVDGEFMCDLKCYQVP